MGGGDRIEDEDEDLGGAVMTPPRRPAAGPGEARSHLFCEEHGRAHEERAAADEEDYRRLGEAVLIVRGPVKGASQRCRACGARLRRGQEGYAVTAFARPPTVDEMGRYDYAREGEALALEHAVARLYGAVEG